MYSHVSHHATEALQSDVHEVKADGLPIGVSQAQCRNTQE
jgi:hypothetical protein